MNESWGKLYLLLWKNYTIQKRQRKKLVVEISIPFFIGMFLLYIRSSVDVMKIETSTIYSPFEVSFIPEVPVSGVRLFDRGCGTLRGQNGCEESLRNATHEIQNKSSIFRTSKFPQATARNAPANGWIVLWSPRHRNLDGVMNKACAKMKVSCYPANDSHTLMRYMTQVSEFPYPREMVLAGVVFPDNLIEKDKLPLDVNVKIRFPAERRFLNSNLRQILPPTWLTALTFPKFQMPGPREGNLNEGGSPGYYSEGFLGVEDAVSSSLLEHYSGMSNPDLKIYLKRFPYPKYVVDRLLGAMQNFLSFLIVISFLFSVNNLVERITTEKEKRLKIIMNIMGLSNTLSWTSWFIYSFFFLSMLIIILVASIKLPFMNEVPVFAMSDWSCITVFFLCYASAAVTFCFLMSTIFSRASTASIASGMIWFLTFIPYYSIQGKYTDIDTSVKILVSLFLNTGMAIGVEIILMYEGAGSGIQWNNLTIPVSPDDGMTMAYVLAILMFDSFLYMGMSLYIQNVFPGEYGIPLPWHYLFHKSYWFGDRDKNDNRIEKISRDAGSAPDDLEDKSNHSDAGIQIKNLTKIYRGSEKAAVDNLNLNMRKNEITVLMGFNGAGKTTTLSILAGVIPPTSGTIIVDGFDIRTNINSARKSLGFCPQHDILFDELTVEEHIQFFAKLKGLKESQVPDEVKRYITLLNLRDKRSTLAKNLSGGMRRKLSVSLALCGNTKVVVCDEPTSGMDPKARRDLWDILASMKKDRTILLTTHFLDEADLLGDSVAIMAEGKLLCHGTTFALKKKFSSGYRLSMVKEDSCDTRKVRELVQHHIPEVSKVQDVGMELSFQLPEKYSSKFQYLLDDIELGKKSLRISSYGITPTTLEDVFMRIAEEVTTKSKSPPIKEEITDEGNEDAKVDIGDNGKTFKNVRKLNQISAMFYKHAKLTVRSWKAYLLLIIIASCGVISAIISLRASGNEVDLQPLVLDLKNFPNGIVFAKRGEKCNSACESFFNAFVRIVEKEKLKLFTLNGSANMDERLLKESEKNIFDYRTRYVLGTAFDVESTKIAITGWFNAEPYHIPPVTLIYIYNSILKALTDASISFTNEPLPYKEETKVSLQEMGMDNGLQISIFVAFSYIFVSSYFVIFYIQEKVTKAKLLQFVSGVDILTFWCVSFAWNLIMSLGPNVSLLITLAIFQEEGFKQPEEIGYCALALFSFFMSMLPLIYLSSLFFNKPAVGFIMMTFFNGITGIYTAILIVIFQLPVLNLLGMAKTLDWIFSLFPLYSMVQSFQNVNLSSKRLKMCKEIYENHCLKKDDFIHVCCKESKKCPEGNCVEWTESIWDWNQPGIGRYIAFLFATGIGFFVMLLIIESRILYKLKFRKKANEKLETGDSDVNAEREKVMAVPVRDREKFNLLIDGVSKSFGKVKAVKNMYLALDKFECFGLLGTNGAGKTTAFKMLTGDECPTSGNIYVKGISLRKDMKKVYKMIGYCPQFDALFDDLTGREHLYLYCLLRGIPKSDIDEVTTKLSRDLMFNKFLDKRVAQYSGGNKRKLSTALALIGDPSLVYLDEPTSGMDPIAKRHLWSALSRVRSLGTTVILTSHSMEECEALCTRLAIMVQGEFKCLGSSQYLKTKFSQGYSLVVKMEKGGRYRKGLDEEAAENLRASNLEDIKKYVTKNFQGASLIEIHQERLVFRIPHSNVTLSRMFDLIESVKENLGIEDYTLGQTTLEQVLLAFTGDNNE